tara:strand:+ start:740 stop:1174 length:435 start_codon:yes stop_codon:yes gene_type:complete
MVNIKEINANQAKLCFSLDSKTINLWSFVQWEDTLKRKEVKSLGIYKGKRILGVCVFHMIFEEAELLYLAIHPEFSRKGFGRVLFENFLNILKVNNIKKIFVEVSSKNIPAINFYEIFDFKTINVRKKYYKDGSDAILKVKLIF